MRKDIGVGGADVVDDDDDDGVQAYMVAVFSQPVARPAERVIILAHLKITIVNIVAIFYSDCVPIDNHLLSPGHR